ncbi:hypothetical protein KCP73_01025 [Salmonella enterica subsp. enterica]|nr:hypothetical protein KCP73_01025 [Salmonella enterica subsp. enterica]
MGFGYALSRIARLRGFHSPAWFRLTQRQLAAHCEYIREAAASRLFGRFCGRRCTPASPLVQKQG